MKDKIAISLDRETLDKIDRYIDGKNVRSRSQAIEVLIRKALMPIGVDTVVLILSKKHSDIPKRPFKSSNVLDQQIKFFRRNEIKNFYVLAQGDLEIKDAILLKTKKEYNADALRTIKDRIKEDFVVMSGDTYNNFDLMEMAKKHINSGKIATIGLMSSPLPNSCGTAILEGDLVVAFEEKPKIPASNVVNSGIYIFSTEIFGLLKGSLERHVLPELAKRRQLVGYFTMGEYAHFGEK